MAKAWHLVTYDVRDDKRLRRVARLLESYGERLQYSVFRCHLTDREMQRLRWELAKAMAADDDLLIIGLCERCVGQIQYRREESGWPEEPRPHRVI